MARLLFEPLKAGAVTCVNGFGTGVADDKLVHAYVEDMIRFYLRDEPLLPSVRTYDLSDSEALEDVLDRLSELAIKPRTGHGAWRGRRSRMQRWRIWRKWRTLSAGDPNDFVAQDTILLSRHPTVIDGRLEPRHVDLRPFVFLTPDGPVSRTRWPDPRRAGARRARRQQLPARRGQGHVGSMVSPAPLVGVSTSEVRTPGDRELVAQGEPARTELALGERYLDAVRGPAGCRSSWRRSGATRSSR